MLKNEESSGTEFQRYGGPQLSRQKNRPFPSSLVPLFQNEPFISVKMNSACSFIFKQIKVIFIRMVLHFDSL